MSRFPGRNRQDAPALAASSAIVSMAAGDGDGRVEMRAERDWTVTGEKQEVEKARFWVSPLL